MLKTFDLPNDLEMPFLSKAVGMSGSGDHAEVNTLDYISLEPCTHDAIPMTSSIPKSFP